MPKKIEKLKGQATDKETDKNQTKPAKEIGGPKGPEHTRYGDWERKGITSDFWSLYDGGQAPIYIDRSAVNIWSGVRSQKTGHIGKFLC